MKSRKSSDEGANERGKNTAEGNTYNKKKKMKKNMQRLGGAGAGLSLEVFANAKSRNSAYNPALLKKKREFYKNAKHVGKYKKMVEQQSQHNGPSFCVPPAEDNESVDVGGMKKKSKNKGMGSYSLKSLYERKHEEEEKARMERESIARAKKEEQQRAEDRRKALREKMFKKTRKGQPVMKYRIEHLLETIQRSS